MIVESDQLPLMRTNIRVMSLLKTAQSTIHSMHYRLSCSQINVVLNYRLFARQEVFSDAKKILSVLPEAFDEAFLWKDILLRLVTKTICY